MITTKNFEDLLKALEFETEGNTYKKSIGEATLKVDFDKKDINLSRRARTKSQRTPNMQFLAE